MNLATTLQVITVDAAELEVACHSGMVWITRHGDLRDLILQPGESTRLEAMRLVIGALRASEIELSACDGGVRQMPVWRRFVVLLSRVLGKPRWSG